MATAADFKTVKPQWCPACGDFAVLAALQNAAAALGLEPENVVSVTGIGCSGKLSQYFGSYGVHSLHGRSIPTAVGVKMGNRDLTVIAAGGDGDGYGLGLSHFIHTMRRNIDITYLVMDNHIYGLTTGQASPTSDLGMKTKTSPSGVVEWPIRPLELALSAGCGFIAQAYSGTRKHLEAILQAAIQHRGFSLVNIFSPCVTFNKINTYDFYKEQCVNLDADPNYDRTDRMTAYARVAQGEQVVGIIFQEEGRPTYEEALPGFSKVGLAKQDLTLSDAYLQGLVAELS